MFNLLMKGMPWGAGRDTVILSCLFEYTDDEIAAMFKDGNEILLDTLIQLPCLFMQEGTGDQIALVGTITRARVSGKEVSIEYTYELDIPSLLNSTIYANTTEFDMPHEFELSRTHWAVKDVDLYRVLLRNLQPRRQRPTVFTIPEHENIEHENIESVLVSAMMPFDAGFTTVYDSIKAAAEKVVLMTSGKIQPSFRISCP